MNIFSLPRTSTRRRTPISLTSKFTAPNQWLPALSKVFDQYTPIVIGYAGNDGSLMDFLQALEGKTLYWCLRTSASMLGEAIASQPERVKRLAEKHRIHFVPVDSFDHAMASIWGALASKYPEKFPDLLAALKEKHRNREVAHDDQRAALWAKREDTGTVAAATADVSAPPSAGAAIVDATQSLRALVGKEGDRRDAKPWWHYQQEIDEIDDVDAKEMAYQKSLDALPMSAPLLNNFAIHLQHVRKRHDEAEALYERAIAAAPTDADILGNFADFQSDIRHRHDEAEDLHQRAIKADPKHANNLNNFAVFLIGIRQRHDEAEALYQRAIDADPKHANHLGNFAIFLTTFRERHDEADALFQRAIEEDPEHANNLGNYALFLTDIRGRHDEAEALYERAIAADPKDANHLGNFAVFLTDIRGRYDGAEALYERAIAADPKHANSLSNFADFLTDIRGRHDEAEALYQRAIASTGRIGVLPLRARTRSSR